MPKATLTFNLPEESSEHRDALEGSKLRAALSDVGNDVFRPARKHGYSDPDLQKLVDNTPGAVELIGKLEELFYATLRSWDVEID